MHWRSSTVTQSGIFNQARTFELGRGELKLSRKFAEEVSSLAPTDVNWRKQHSVRIQQGGTERHDIFREKNFTLRFLQFSFGMTFSPYNLHPILLLMGRIESARLIPAPIYEIRSVY